MRDAAAEHPAAAELAHDIEARDECERNAKLAEALNDGRGQRALQLEIDESDIESSPLYEGECSLDTAHGTDGRKARSEECLLEVERNDHLILDNENGAQGQTSPVARQRGINNEGSKRSRGRK